MNGLLGHPSKDGANAHKETRAVAAERYKASIKIRVLPHLSNLPEVNSLHVDDPGRGIYFAFMKTTFAPSGISMRLSAHVPQQPLADRER
jgi:hypothetical protein